jgi:hypothetical protein
MATPEQARAAALTTIDLDDWLRQAGSWSDIDWSAWDRAYARFAVVHRAGLAPLPARKS